MKDLFKNKLLWSFVGGVAAAVAGSKCECARNAAVKSVATGMQIKDEALATYDTIVEDAKDIYAEAKSKKEAK